jgi:hypothetical protein
MAASASLETVMEPVTLQVADDGADENIIDKSVTESAITFATESTMWSVGLVTPSTSDLFSPAKQMTDKDALHGAGKLVWHF